MKTTIDIPEHELRDAMRFTRATTKREAVVKVPEEFNQRRRMAELAKYTGTFSDRFPTNDEIETIDAKRDRHLRLLEFQRVDKVNDGVLWVAGLWVRVTIVMSAIALLLSLAGIYAVLSFTVSRRTREIGVRVAVGASRLRVVAAIFRRPLFQVGLGVLAGGALIVVAGSIETDMPGLSGELSLRQVAIILGYAILMLGVCLLACVVPTRRALGVEPTIALRMD